MICGVCNKGIPPSLEIKRRYLCKLCRAKKARERRLWIAKNDRARYEKTLEANRQYLRERRKKLKAA